MTAHNPSIPTDADLPVDDLAQAAFSAYVDAAQAEGHAHQRLATASRAAALAVVEALRAEGLLRFPLMQLATHGTVGGYGAGCRCRFCTEAQSLTQRSNYHWSKEQGHNKVADTLEVSGAESEGQK